MKLKSIYIPSSSKINNMTTKHFFKTIWPNYYKNGLNHICPFCGAKSFKILNKMYTCDNPQCKKYNYYINPIKLYMQVFNYDYTQAYQKLTNVLNLDIKFNEVKIQHRHVVYLRHLAYIYFNVFEQLKPWCNIHNRDYKQVSKAINIKDQFKQISYAKAKEHLIYIYIHHNEIYDTALEYIKSLNNLNQKFNDEI